MFSYMSVKEFKFKYVFVFAIITFFNFGIRKFLLFDLHPCKYIIILKWSLSPISLKKILTPLS